MNYYHLGLGSASSLVFSLELHQWGTFIVVHAIYDPLGERVPFQLVFRGCSQLRIEQLPGSTLEREADLLGITLGKEDGSEPAVLTTDLFEMQITYQHFECIKDTAALLPTAMST